MSRIISNSKSNHQIIDRSKSVKTMSKTMSSLKPERMKMVDSNSMTPPCHDINNINHNHNHHNDGKIIPTAVLLRIPHKSEHDESYNEY